MPIKIINDLPYSVTYGQKDRYQVLVVWASDLTVHVVERVTG